MSLSDECFICMNVYDPENGLGDLFQLKVSGECKCSPFVHEACIVQWYTGDGGKGRDICPVCRSSGSIQNIRHLILRIPPPPSQQPLLAAAPRLRENRTIDNQRYHIFCQRIFLFSLALCFFFFIWFSLSYDWNNKKN